MVLRSAILGLWMASCAAAAVPPTYSRDVAPILNQRCVSCHRPGEAAPMALRTYKEVRPWAKAIRDAVAERKMPPWPADPQHGKFANSRRLAAREVETITAWVAAGAPEGDPADLPPGPQFAGGWTIGEPDLIIDMGAEFEVPRAGEVPYQYFFVPGTFTEDTWVSAAEIRPGERSVVHHAIVLVNEPGWNGFSRGDAGSWLAGYAPGMQGVVHTPDTAKLIRAGSSFVFQMHYTATGKAVRDRTRLGLRFAKQPPKYRAMTAKASAYYFRIPAGDPNYEVQSNWAARENVELIGLRPHMHLRGKDFQYVLVHPDGRREILLNVPRYDFNWQMIYEFAAPLAVPRGARIECVAHFDNSARNKFNPDPTVDVSWGDQTWDEMMIGWVFYRVPWGS
jgi:hypothetical protein